MVSSKENRRVAVLTPAVYQALATRGLGPRLERHVEPARLPWRLQAARVLLGQDLAPALRPQPVSRFVAEGGTGVALFEEGELHEFLSEAKDAPADEPRRGRWWEFWRTDQGSYAMFPGDDARRPSLATTLWIPMGRSAQVRRIDLTPLVGIGDRKALDRPVVPPEPCTLLANEVEPGAPYVGRCENVGCDDGCSPHVVVQPDDGIYRLRGCNC
jgi:hypothetical protein